MNKMRKGFSYIETLLALLIMSLALFPAVEGFRQSALNQAYAESRYMAFSSAGNILQTMADALRRDKDITQVFLKESGTFPADSFSCRLYVSDESESKGYRIFTVGEPPEAEEFVPPAFYESKISKKKPDLRIGEEISYLNGDISAEEEDERLRVTISSAGGKNFYCLVCEDGFYGGLYVEKQSDQDIFVEIEAAEGAEIKLEAAEGVYIIMTEKEEERKFLVLDIYGKKESGLFKRLVRLL